MSDYRHLDGHIERVLLRCTSAGVDGVPDTHHDCGMTVAEARDVLEHTLSLAALAQERNAALEAERDRLAEKAVEAKVLREALAKIHQGYHIVDPEDCRDGAPDYRVDSFIREATREHDEAAEAAAKEQTNG